MKEWNYLYCVFFVTKYLMYSLDTIVFSLIFTLVTNSSAKILGNECGNHCFVRTVAMEASCIEKLNCLDYPKYW